MKRSGRCGRGRVRGGSGQYGYRLAASATVTRRVALAAVSGMWFGIAACKGHAQQSEKNGAGAVEFLVGDLMADEGGEWEPESGPLRSPFGVDFDGDGNLYVVELRGGRVHRLDPAGELRPVAGDGSAGYAGDGGPALEATFDGMHNCVVRGQDLLIADSWNHCVRKIELESGQIETIIGTGQEGFSGDGGPARQAEFNFVMCIELSHDGDTLHITDLKNRRIRDVDLNAGIVRTAAGNGQRGVPVDGAVATESPLVDPRAAASDPAGNLYVLERGGHALRVVRPNGSIETVAGTGVRGWNDGPALQAQLGSPKHLCTDEAGNVYIADDQNGAIRRYDPRGGTVTTLLGRGMGDPRIRLKNPHGVRVQGDWLYVVDTGNHRLMRLPLAEEE